MTVNKIALNAEDIRAKYITPFATEFYWDETAQICCQVYFVEGRIICRGQSGMSK